MPPYLMSPAFTFRRQDKSHLLQATISAQIHRPRPKNPQVSATSESTIPDREPSRVPDMREIRPHVVCLLRPDKGEMFPLHSKARRLRQPLLRQPGLGPQLAE
jgi:hypothetical protein